MAPRAATTAASRRASASCCTVVSMSQHGEAGRVPGGHWFAVGGRGGGAPWHPNVGNCQQIAGYSRPGPRLRLMESDPASALLPLLLLAPRHNYACGGCTTCDAGASHLELSEQLLQA